MGWFGWLILLLVFFGYIVWHTKREDARRAQAIWMMDKAKAKAKAEELPADDENTVLVKTMFGFQLGENIADLRKRFKLTTGVKTSDPDDPSECWRVTPSPANTKFVSLVTFEDCVIDILICFTDSSSVNFAAIQEQHRRTYNIEFEDTVGLDDEKWVFETSVEGVTVSVGLELRSEFMKDNELYLRYAHGPLYEKLWKKISRRKTARISGNL